jgi:DNA-binding CsgD family transcriptional regulator
MEKLRAHSEGFQKFVGIVGAALQLGLMITDYAEPDDVFFGPVYLVFALVLLASARFAFLGPAQAALFFAVSGMQTADTLNSFYGMGFAIVAALVVFRRGWFVHRSVVKAIAITAIGWAFLVLPIVFSGKTPFAQSPAIISALIYGVLVVCLARSRDISAFAPRKRLLRLAEYKLTAREIRIVKARLGGQSVKELATGFGLAESTVRNALSFAYRKLKLNGSEDLMALGERYQVE